METDMTWSKTEIINIFIFYTLIGYIKNLRNI